MEDVIRQLCDVSAASSAPARDHCKRPTPPARPIALGERGKRMHSQQRAKPLVIAV
jgi:hypothetical protein